MWLGSAIAVLLSFVSTVLAQGSYGGDQSSCNSSQAWVYRGCYDDGPNGRHAGFTWQLSSAASNEKYYPGYTGSMSVDICLLACRGHGFRFAALYVGTNCYCASVFPNPGVPSPAVTTSGPGAAAGTSPGTAGGVCTTPCPANTLEFCGGATAISLYEDPSFVNTPATQSVSNYLYLGCYSYVAPGPQFVTIKTVSTFSCQTYCAALGYPYSIRSGIDSNTGSTTCGCGTEIQAGLQVAENQCLYYCNGTSSAL